MPSSQLLALCSSPSSAETYLIEQTFDLSVLWKLTAECRHKASRHPFCLHWTYMKIMFYIIDNYDCPERDPNLTAIVSFYYWSLLEIWPGINAQNFSSPIRQLWWYNHPITYCFYSRSNSGHVAVINTMFPFFRQPADNYLYWMSMRRLVLAERRRHSDYFMDSSCRSLY